MTLPKGKTYWKGWSMIKKNKQCHNIFFASRIILYEQYLPSQIPISSINITLYTSTHLRFDIMLGNFAIMDIIIGVTDKSVK